MQNIKYKTYPIKTILKAISAYNLGYTLDKTKDIINKRNNLSITSPTIHTWLQEYKTICTFSRLRKQALKQCNCTPQNIIHTQTLSHIQPYTFKCHNAKLEILTKENPKFTALKDCIEKIISNKFPHHIFTYNKNNEIINANEQRASQIKFSHLKIEIKNKENFACKLASLALNLAKNNNERHQAIQDFMLINDSTTIAVEVPIYLSNCQKPTAQFSPKILHSI